MRSIYGGARWLIFGYLETDKHGDYNAGVNVLFYNLFKSLNQSITIETIPNFLFKLFDTVCRRDRIKQNQI